MTGDGPHRVIERVRGAINAHDLEAFLDCFDEGYESEQPLHPERSFRGRERVRRNWSANLARVPDLRWELVDGCFSAAAWCEWRWHGRRLDGGRFDRASSSTASRTAGSCEDGCTWATCPNTPKKRRRHEHCRSRNRSQRPSPGGHPARLTGPRSSVQLQ
jgi:hypothetical protein